MNSKKVYVLQCEQWPFYEVDDDKYVVQFNEEDNNHIVEMSETEWEEYSATQQAWKRWQDWLKEKAGY
jgi:hypothetical protein